MKLYQYVKILYVQAKCSMLPSVLALCAPPRPYLQDRDTDECIEGGGGEEEEPTDCVLYSSFRL